MGWLMEPIYNAISWILLRWHWVWDHILPGDGFFLGTTWDWVLAIVFLVITVRLILFPIFVKQIRSQRAMQALAPKVKELQAKHKGDQQTLREEMMKLYQTEKVNPLMGCLPLLLQIPVFFGLFHVLSYLKPDEDNKTLYGWTVTQFDSAVVARLFTAPIPARFADGADQLAHLGASGVAVKVVAGILVLIMMLTTFMTSRQMILKTGWSQDQQQRMIQKLMLYGIPFSLLLSGWYFPIGVIIYWVVQNLFSLGQQYWVLHKYPPPVTENNIPAKTASERARQAAAATKAPGFLARFFKVLPPPPKPAAGLVDESRSGLFRRRTVQEIPPASSAPRSLAPRPGAKPKSSPSTPTPSPSESAGSDAVADTAAPKGGPTGAQAPGSGGKSQARGSGTKATPTPAKSTPAKSTPAKPAPAKATPATKAAPAAKANGTPSSPAKAGRPSTGANANGASANGTTPAGDSSAAAPSGAGAPTSGGASGNGARRQPSTAKKAQTPARKGQSNRKRGAKR